MQTYAWSVAAAAAGVAIMVALAPWLGVGTALLILLLPVVATAWQSGGRAAVVTGVASAAAALVFFFVSPPFRASMLDVSAAALLYAGFALALARFGNALQEARERASGAHAQWESSLRQLRSADTAAAQDAARRALAARTARIEYWQWDLETGRVERDAEAGMLLAASANVPRELTIDEAWILVHADDRPQAQAEVQEAIAKGGTYALTLRLKLPNGAVRWIEVHGAVICDAAHRPTHVSGVIIDIDGRMRAEEALRASEERFRSLVDHAPALLWGVDVDGSMYLNREYLRFAGVACAPGDALECWRAVAHPDDVEEYVAHYTDAVQHRALFERQVRLRRADGEYRWFKSIGVPRQARGGTFLGYVGCSFDVTEMKQYIVELARAERTLLDADRRKDEFLSSLSQELRNPLQPIRQAMSMLEGSSPAQHQFQRAREVIDRQVAQLARVLDDISDAARMAQRKLDLRLERLDVRDVVARALEASRPLFESKEQMLDVALPEEPLHVDADAARLEHVVMILLENAAKHTERGHPVSVRVDEEGAHACVAVRDYGAGIAPADLSCIFHMFGEDGAPSGLAHTGLGIELGLARGVVRMHGGRLEAHSDGLGKGSEFRVILPCAASSPATHSPAATPAEHSRALRILIADDVRDAAEILAIALRVGGNDVRIATDGMEALDIAMQFRPQVAVLDIGMPKLTGYEVARHLRGEPWAEGLILIALTGWGQQDDIRRALEVGFNYHMVKPVNLPQLQELLEQLVDRRAERV